MAGIDEPSAGKNMMEQYTRLLEIPDALSNSLVNFMKGHFETLHEHR